MIRAAVLAARPQMLIGDQPKLEAIDTYDASRYRQEILAVLESWGWSKEDLELYEALIDGIVFSRAENSDKAPGTVTAKRLARWLKSFRQGIVIHKAQDIVLGDEPGQASLKDRAKARARDAWNSLVGYVTGIEIDTMDEDLVEAFITGAVPAISNFGKISLRTNTMVNGGFPFAITGPGLSIPFSLGAGGQFGAIIKRLNGTMEVRLVAGWMLNARSGWAAAARSRPALPMAKATSTAPYGKRTASRFNSRSSSAKDGKEDFTAVQSYLRTLITGTLPTTEEWAKSSPALKSPRRAAST
jgi:hypothetical protein